MKPPDGICLMSNIVVKRQECLVWDVTYTDTLAAGYITANRAVIKKEKLYFSIIVNYHFLPLVLKTKSPLVN